MKHFHKLVGCTCDAARIRRTIFRKITRLNFSCNKYFLETIYGENKQQDLNCGENRQKYSKHEKKYIIIKIDK